MRKRERLAGSKAYRLRFEAEKPRPPSKLRHTESAADALSDVLADAVLPVDETEEEENVGVQAVRTGKQGAESSVRRMSKQRQKKQIQRQYAAAQIGQAGGGGPGPRRIWKHVDPAEADRPADLQRVVEIRLRLAGKPHDEVRGK